MMCLSLPWFTYAVFIRISVYHGISKYFPHSDNTISVLENHPMLEFFAVSCFCLPGYILPVDRSLQLLKLPDMHQGRHWPHQVLGQELSQNLTKSSTAPLKGNVKWKHHPKHCGIQIFDNHQPVSLCKKWLKYYPTTWMDRGRFPVTCLPPIYLPWTWTLDPSGASAPSGPRFWAVFSIFQPLGFSKAKTCIG